jgi:cation diffusion facilitator CzcD-associated flavoprotein CzcO
MYQSSTAAMPEPASEERVAPGAASIEREAERQRLAQDVAEHPNDPERRLRYAQALYSVDRDAAVDQLRELLDLEWDHGWRLLRATKLLLSARETGLARTALMRASSLGSHHERAFSADLTHARGLLAWQERADASAERHLRSAHAADPHYAPFAGSILTFLVSHRRIDEARAFANRVEHRLTDRAYFAAIRRGLGI